LRRTKSFPGWPTAVFACPDALNGMDSSNLFDSLSDISEQPEENVTLEEVPEVVEEVLEQGPQFMKDFRARMMKGGRKYVRREPKLALKFVEERLSRSKYVQQCRMKKLHFWLEKHQTVMIFHPLGARQGVESFTLKDYSATPVKETLLPVLRGSAINPFWESAQMVHVAGLIEDAEKLRVQVSQRFIPTVKQPEPVMWVENGVAIPVVSRIDDLDAWNEANLRAHNSKKASQQKSLDLVCGQLITAQRQILRCDRPELPVLSYFSFQRLLLDMASKGLYGGAHPLVQITISLDDVRPGICRGFATATGDLPILSSEECFIGQVLLIADESPGLFSARVLLVPIERLDQWIQMVAPSPPEQTNSGLYGGAHPPHDQAVVDFKQVAAVSSASSSSVVPQPRVGYEGKYPCVCCGEERARGRWDPLQPCVMRCEKCRIQLNHINVRNMVGRHPDIDDLDEEQKDEVMVSEEPPEEKREVSELSVPPIVHDKPIQILRRARHDGDRVCDVVLTEAYFAIYGARYESFDKFDYPLQSDEDQRIVSYTSVKCDPGSVGVTRVKPSQQAIDSVLFWKRFYVGLRYILGFAFCSFVLITFLYFNSLFIISEEENRSTLLAEKEYQVRSWWHMSLQAIGFTRLPTYEQGIYNSTVLIVHYGWCRAIGYVVYLAVTCVLFVACLLHLNVPKDNPLPFIYCPALLATIMENRTEKTTVDVVEDQAQSWLRRVRVLNIPSRIHNQVANATVQVALAVFRLKNFQAWGKLFLIDL